MTNMTVRGTDGALANLGEGPSVLGERPPSLQVSGHVRGGVMVPTKAYQDNSVVQEVYRRGVLAGAPWKQIQGYLRKKLKIDKNPLVMTNTPFFHVKSSDFPGQPETAQNIMDTYAEPRREDDELEMPGQEDKRLYRFPVVFPLDKWLACLPNGFTTWRANERVYWSEYDADDRRMCKMFAPVEIDPKTKRAKRPWGGRQIVYRPENGGICDPSVCPEYQKMLCNFSGRVLFYIPGIPGGGLMDLTTGSWYSLNPMRSVMEEVLAVRGRLSGLRNDGQPLFWLCKYEGTISRIDRETGKPKKQKQKLIRLERHFDIAGVLAHQEDPDDAATVLQGDEEPPPIEGEWVPADFEEDQEDQ